MDQPVNDREMKIEKSFTWGNVGAMVIPVITLVAMFAVMRSDIQQNKKDVSAIRGFNDNIGVILTAHTSSLAEHEAEINSLEKNVDRIMDSLIRIEEKIDSIR